MSNWKPLHVHSHYSILDGIEKPSSIISECIAKGYDACGLSDHGSVSGTIDFLSEAKKKNIKPVLGCELYISNQDASIQNVENRKLSHLVVFAKNDSGYRNLTKIVTESNKLFYYRPRIDLERLKQYSENIIVINGHPGSQLAVTLQNQGYNQAFKQAEWYKSIFGENFFIEISLVDGSETSRELAKQLRSISNSLQIKKVASCDAHYANKSRVDDQRVLLCSSLQTTMKRVKDSLGTEEEFGLSGFFECNNFDIPTKEFISELHKGYDDEIENSKLITDMVEDYNILQNPTTPKFDCKKITESEYLTQLCRDGWVRRKMNEREETKQSYVDRVKRELNVIQNAKLDGYFLIVQDYVNWAKQQGYLVGPGRGSGAGSLVSYLLGITEINPIPHNLLFERFYNSGRNTKDHISMPDIDVDFPQCSVKNIRSYITEKYGKDNVGSICTFGTLQGRAALKEVIRIHGSCDNTLANEICKKLPDKTDILEELEDSDDGSMIRYTLEYEPKLLQEWCRIDDKGNFVGSMAKIFQQAVRLEGTIKSMGKHAAGVVIANEPISDKCPLVRAKDGTLMTGFDMKSVEKVGYIKFDILTTEVLDVLQECNEMIKRGEL